MHERSNIFQIKKRICINQICISNYDWQHCATSLSVKILTSKFFKKKKARKMPYAIEPQEVLAYLNELGYKNISAQQLKEFIRDLKKLIKYDLRIRKDIENVQPKDTNDDIFRTLYETRTTSSKAKEVPKKEKVITVQIKKPPKRTFEDKSSPSVINSLSTANRTRVENSGETESFNEDDDEGYVEEEKTRPKSSDDIDAIRSLHRGARLRPKTSFIRPRMHLRPCKSDPVALYHAYQAEWKKQKFPGEENHANLRWAIRERMLGEPSQGFHPAGSIEALSRKRGPPRRT